MRKQRVFWVSVSAAILLLGLASPVLAQSQTQAPQDSLPSNEQLDALAAAHQWNELGAALSRPGSTPAMSRALEWLHTRIDAGGSFFLGLLYARDLWVLGSQLKTDDPSKDLRMTAGMITLYTEALIIVDGMRCKDQTAPGHRMDQLVVARAPTIAFLRSQPSDLKAKIVDLAIVLERRTAPLRQDDGLMCRGGMEEMRAGLAHGTQLPPTQMPGQVGNSVEVSPPPGWTPELVPPDAVQAKQASLRPKLREVLLATIR